jgi:RND superfamily putative drug exporter
MLPDGEPARVVSERLQDEFAGDAAEEFTVVVADGAADPTGTLDRLASDIAALPGVAATNVDPAGWVSVVPSIEMVSDEGEELVEAIRDLDIGDQVLVGGQTAQLLDTRSAIADRLPLALAIIVVATAVLLFALSGSVLIPVKALLLNLLSLTAAFGAMVWVFQDGNFAGLLGFTATGVVDTSMPILLFCIAFGLSMDYEVFLLSRIKEEHDRTGDNDRSVALGTERTGRIVSAAAVLMSVTFIAFGTSGVAVIKMFGVTLALAILMDAFVVRGLLVPAVMKLAGEANWWAPPFLRRLHRRIAITEGAPVTPPAPAEDRDPVSV